jgi:mannitol/fructose-specific phosphotransferase system IIA component (Ntr-type)
MLPQAGVAAVEAVYAAAILGRPEIAAIILPAIVFFEVVGVFMVDRGLRAWLDAIRANEAAIRKERMHSRRSEAVHMLMAHLPIECIKLNLSGTTKKEVIEELVDHACHVSEEHIDRVQALQVLGEREQLAPTALGNGIAVPHCRLRGIDNPVLFLGRHDKGVPFGGLDDEPCTLIFLMMTCARDPGQHLRLLAALSQILNSAEVRKRFIEAQSPEEIINILTELSSQARSTAPKPSKKSRCTIPML